MLGCVSYIGKQTSGCSNDSIYNIGTSVLDAKRATFLLFTYHGSLLGETIEAGRLLSADLTALFTKSADTDRVICWVSAIMLCETMIMT